MWSASIRGISPFSLSRKNAAYFNSAITCPDHGAGLGRVRLSSTSKSGLCLMSDVRVSSPFHPHLLLARHPPLYIFPSLSHLEFEQSCLRLVLLPLPPLPRPASKPLSPPSSPVCFRFLRFISTFLTTPFTSQDIHAFYNPLENVRIVVRGNPPGAKVAQGPVT